MAQNSKLEAMVDKSSVEAARKAQKEKEAAMKKAEQEIADASFQEKKARRDAKQEVERIKKITQKKVRKAEDTAAICFMAAFISMILALARNEVLIMDVASAVLFPFMLVKKITEWMICPTYVDCGLSGKEQTVAFGTVAAWIARIVATGLILAGVVIVSTLMYSFYEEYRRQWDYISVFILSVVTAILVAVGDMIRDVVPVNLIILFIVIIVISTEIRKKIEEHHIDM
jgi:hypothetical protein